MAKVKIERGSAMADPKFKIRVTEKGPYLVFGNPPLAQEFIMLNNEGECWYFQRGRSFDMSAQPTALCRCGASKKKPYCDGSHTTAAWDPRLTADMDDLLDNVEITQGDGMTLTDNQKYCVFARFCDAKGRVWNLAENSDDPQACRTAIREASICPGGRLLAWDNRTEKPIEYKYAPELGLIEDPAIGSSGGLWVKGGIVIKRESGEAYEVRNRVVLCRCGASSNKPYCDGTHASMRFNDNLEGVPNGETIPEKEGVY